MDKPDLSGLTGRRAMAGHGRDDDILGIVRRAYARQMLAVSGALGNKALEDAVATVRRESFLPDGPWRIFSVDGGGTREIPPDPALIYQNALVVLSAGRGVNNGSPALHAHWMNESVRPGDRVVHVGAGTGYYSALIAEVVGPTGSVLAVEVDEALAAVASRALGDRANVIVETGDGADFPDREVDLVYVNASVVRPAASWIDNLAAGGRLVFPLGAPAPRSVPGPRFARFGAAILVERTAAGFRVRVLGSARFVVAEGKLAGTAAEEEALSAAFERGGIEFVRRLRWREPPDPATSWYVSGGWSLAYDVTDGDSGT